MAFLLPTADYKTATQPREREPEASCFDDGTRRDILLQCLMFDNIDDTPILSLSIEKLQKLKVIPFEVIAGTPCERYGARLTFRAAGGAAVLAAAFGLTEHPWGAPDWVGLRLSRSGGLKVKAYHRLTDVRRFRLPPGLPTPLYPVMAALHEDAVEVYLRFGACCTWTAFVQRCCGALGEVQRSFAPHPRPVESAFCLSLRWQGEQLVAVSVFADYRALPDDETIAQRWCEGMTARDRQAYELALAGVRSLGRGPYSAWHAMLGWTLESNGSWHRAASLYVPR